ncbi:MAG: aminodeoxychorismate synthase component I [bacterium]|nr:aminodeoxychorismate synthase component I [bacterium]
MSQVKALAIRELTPPPDALACFEVLRRQPMPWLLDSDAANGPLARYTFMGADPYLVLRSRRTRNTFGGRRSIAHGFEPGVHHVVGDPLVVAEAAVPRIDDLDSVLAGIVDPPPFLTGAVGYLGYEVAQVCEPVELGARDDFGLPDLVLLYNDRMLVIDHEAQRGFAVGLGFADTAQQDIARGRALEAAEAIEILVCEVREQGPRRQKRGAATVRRAVLEHQLPDAASACFDEKRYGEAVETIRDEIAAGNVYQANLTQRIDLPSRGNATRSDAERGWQLYRALRRVSPAPFAAYLALPEVTIVSSSPERFLCLDREGMVESRPIKGTRPRGASPEEDALLAKDLEGAQKDRAENLMIVDLVRNDLGRVCETGSVHVPELMAIESYATVFQMVSTVRGRLRKDCSAADLVRATFPPGSMTGAPKIAAMQIIDRIEPVRRSIYSGAIGYFDAAGGFDLSVVIRTLLVRDGQVHLHSGGAVVSDSDPEAEYRESLDKIRALLAAVECSG